MHILYATDGSPGAREGERLLIGLRLDREDQISIVSVVPHVADDETLATLAAAQSALRQTGANVSSCMRMGHPADAILRLAEERAVDLIVVGTRGLSPVPRFFLGSVSERVARHASCSVLLARAGHTELRHVLIGIDGSAGAAKAATWLRSFPLPPESEIHLATAVPFLEDLVRIRTPLPPPLRGHQETLALDTRRRREAEAYLHELTAAFEATGRRAGAEIEEGNPAAALLHLSNQESIDLLVVGSEGHSAIEGFVMGSVSEKVLRHAHCSVLIVR